MSDTKRTRHDREPIQVHLDAQDSTLLDELVRVTGLAKAELLRRGLRRLSADTQGDRAPGWSLDRLIGVVDDADAHASLAADHDRFLYDRPKRCR